MITKTEAVELSTKVYRKVQDLTGRSGKSRRSTVG